MVVSVTTDLLIVPSSVCPSPCMLRSFNEKLSQRMTTLLVIVPWSLREPLGSPQRNAGWKWRPCRPWSLKRTKCEECSKSSQLENHLPRKSAVGDIEPVSIFALCFAFMLCLMLFSELSTVIKSSGWLCCLGRLLIVAQACFCESSLIFGQCLIMINQPNGWIRDKSISISKVCGAYTALA